MFYGKDGADFFITDITARGYRARTKQVLNSTSDLVAFEGPEDLKAKLPNQYYSIKLVKAETLEKYIRSRYVIACNHPDCRYVVKRTARHIRMTYDSFSAMRFKTVAEAEKYMKTLRPTDPTVRFYVTERKDFNG